MNITNYSTRQFKLIATILATVFTLLVFIISVWAAATLSFNVTSTVSFTASSVAGQVNAEIDGGYIARPANGANDTYNSGIQNEAYTLVTTTDSSSLSNTMYTQLDNIYLWTAEAGATFEGKKVYLWNQSAKGGIGAYEQATSATINSTNTYFAASNHSNGTIAFQPGDTISPWNLNSITFEENPVNTVAPILMTFTIKNTGNTPMNVSFESVNDNMVTDDEDNLKIEYSIDGTDWIDFEGLVVADSSINNVLSNIETGNVAKLIIRISIESDAISITTPITIQYSLCFSLYNDEIITWDGTSSGTSASLDAIGWNYNNLETSFELDRDIKLNDEIFTFNNDTGLVEVTDGPNIAYIGTGTKGDDSGTNDQFDTTAGIIGTFYHYASNTYTAYTTAPVELTREGSTYKYIKYGAVDGTTGQGEINVWEPIGPDSAKVFTGSFNGNNHTISGIYINNLEGNNGLFGWIDEGTIINVGVENSYIKGNDNYVGGVCGNNKGATISNCYNAGSVIGNYNLGGVCGMNQGKIINCYNAGNVSGNGNYAGGVCGYNNGATISNCYNTGSVSINGGDIGGVCGENNGTTSNCYNTGSVSGNGNLGGVCGHSWVTISKCYNTGSVNGNGNNLGGVCGFNENYGVINNCHNAGSVRGSNNNIGSVCGYNKSQPINNCYYLEDTCTYAGGGTMLTLAQMAEPTNLIGWDFMYTWTIGADGYPILLELYPDYIEYTAEDATCFSGNGPYTITTAGQLAYLAYLVNSGTDFLGKTINLANNITINTAIPNDSTTQAQYKEMVGNGTLKQWVTIGTESAPFKGTFNGKRYTISGLYMFNNLDNQGFFGYVDGGSINDLGIINSEIKNVSLVEQNFGMVCGYLAGGTISNCYNTGDVSGFSYVGSVCGKNKGTLSNCYNTGNVSGLGSHVGSMSGYNYGTISNCYNTGDVSGNGGDVGGMSGYNDGTIINCYNTGEISGNDYNVGGMSGCNYGTIINCYNTGEISGTDYNVGGVCSYNYGTISNCCNTGNVSGKAVVGGVCGKNWVDKIISNCYYLDTTNEQMVNATFGIVSGCSFDATGELAETQTINGGSRTTLLSALQNYQIANPQFTDSNSVVHTLSSWDSGIWNGINYLVKFTWQE